jgi:type IV secretory pathway VirB10-like protein
VTVMAETSGAPGTAPVADHRPVPRGVLPRGTQTWLMVGLAVGILVVILIAGRPEPAAKPIPAAPAQAPSADRVRDYQDRLRTLEARAALEAQAEAAAPSTPPTAREESRPPAPEDPIRAERRRRQYESLFASNVVLSRRPEAERPDSGRPASGNPAASSARSGDENPSIDDVAEAVVRATTRLGGNSQPGRAPNLPTNPLVATSTQAPQTTAAPSRPTQTEPISDAGPLHRILEGTIVDTALTNRLDGSSAAPVSCLVTNALYSHSGQHVVIPAGARMLGETKPVQTLGETRLAVAFHRLLMPDGRTYSLDHFIGLNQIGDAGLRDQVNQHYWSTFGAAAAVGLISGLGQYLGGAGLTRGDGDRTVIIAGGATDAAAQASLQVMNRFLNRLPTITIREGHRVKVYITGDLELPAYEVPAVAGRY